MNKDYVVDSLGASGPSRFKVVQYLQRSAQLIVESISYETPKKDDVIYDQKGRRIVLGDIVNIRTPRDHKTLWFDNTLDLMINDVLLLDSGEQVRVISIGSNSDVQVARGYQSDSFFIEEGFKAVMVDKYYFTITTVEPHQLRGLDLININHVLPDLRGIQKIYVTNSTTFPIVTGKHD